MPRIKELRPITSVWSCYGHWFMSTDSEDVDSCLTCGAEYQLVRTPNGISDGEYIALNGAEPMSCAGVNAINHGYAGERTCETCDDGSCDACTHPCNCLLCA